MHAPVMLHDSVLAHSNQNQRLSDVMAVGNSWTPSISPRYVSDEGTCL